MCAVKEGIPGAIGLQLAHGPVLDVGDVALADLHLHLFVFIQGCQEGSGRNGFSELAVLALPAPAAAHATRLSQH